MGFEPMFAKRENGFQDRHHQPLGHPSIIKSILDSIVYRYTLPGNVSNTVCSNYVIIPF
jgi:hypothetical protein